MLSWKRKPTWLSICIGQTRWKFFPTHQYGYTGYHHNFQCVFAKDSTAVSLFVNIFVELDESEANLKTNLMMRRASLSNLHTYPWSMSSSCSSFKILVITWWWKNLWSDPRIQPENTVYVTLIHVIWSHSKNVYFCFVTLIRRYNVLISCWKEDIP